MTTLSHVFDLMDQWRHLPDYQLERRADIFFAAYLPAFLSERSGNMVHPQLIPEFPVRIGTIYPHIPINKSNKIDYVAIAKDVSQCWLVELKTDIGSRRQKQDAYLKAAVKIGMPALIQGIVQIVEATQHKHKYCCLLRLLKQLQWIKLPDTLEAALQSRHWDSAVNNCLKDVTVTVPDMPMHILYIQPHTTQTDEVGFEELAEWLKKIGDETATRFAKSLKTWAQYQPGRPD